MSVPRGGTAGKKKGRWELADVFHQYGEAYRRSHALPSPQLKVMRAIEICRTKELGGHLEQCDQCGFERPVYNSCRNRHCPKCQMLTKARWLEARKTELLPVPYFHVVFTIPHELNPLALCNKKRVYDILFQSVSETLQTFAADPKKGLGGKIGITSILHTWNQTLMDHIHLHCAIPAGALSRDGEKWISARKNFLFSVKALSVVFRGKFLDELKKAKETLIFPGQTEHLGHPDAWSSFINQLYKKEWVVYSKPAFQGPQAVLDYIGRYTHRIAISNNRILSVDKGQVTFSYQDRKNNQRNKMTLSTEEFIRRFLLHTLPPSYVRLRHFGFLANRSKKKDLSRCRELLDIPQGLPEPKKKTTEELLRDLTGVDLSRCPACETGRMHIVAEIPKARGWDTS